jgi:hypothetical protein
MNADANDLRVPTSETLDPTMNTKLQKLSKFLIPSSLTLLITLVYFGYSLENFIVTSLLLLFGLSAIFSLSHEFPISKVDFSWNKELVVVTGGKVTNACWFVMLTRGPGSSGIGRTFVEKLACGKDAKVIVLDIQKFDCNNGKKDSIEKQLHFDAG